VTLEERLAAVESRLRALEDEQAIVDLLYSYGHAIDYGDEELWRDLWTENAVASYGFDVANRKWSTGMQNFVFDGHDEVMRFFRIHPHAPDIYYKHFLIEPRIVIEGDHATATSYYARIEETENGPLLGSFGRYVDELVR
jgi:hypothetical protein